MKIKQEIDLDFSKIEEKVLSNMNNQNKDIYSELACEKFGKDFTLEQRQYLKKS